MDDQQDPGTLAPAPASGSASASEPDADSGQAEPDTVTGGTPASGSVQLSGPAPVGGVEVKLVSHDSAVTLPGSVRVAAGATSSFFAITTRPLQQDREAHLAAVHEGETEEGLLIVLAPVLDALTVSASDASGTNSRGARANCIAAPNVLGTVDSNTGGFQWFSPNSYVAPAPGTFGSCGVGTVRGPGLHTVDFSLQKQFAITENKRVEFRAEAINLANTPILNAPGTGLGAGLGTVTSSQGERNIQFAIKFYF